MPNTPSKKQKKKITIYNELQDGFGLRVVGQVDGAVTGHFLSDHIFCCHLNSVRPKPLFLADTVSVSEKIIGSETDTEIEPWFLFPLPKPKSNIGLTLHLNHGFTKDCIHFGVESEFSNTI